MGKGVQIFPEKFRRVMEPVRFLIACEDGHIDDFPCRDGCIEK
jgi:hypothetical protein